MSLTPETPLPPEGQRKALRPIPMLIFSSRWLQLPLYIGLIVAQGVYVVLFLKELWHLFAHAIDFSEQQIMAPKHTPPRASTPTVRRSELIALQEQGAQLPAARPGGQPARPSATQDDGE